MFRWPGGTSLPVYWICARLGEVENSRNPGGRQDWTVCYRRGWARNGVWFVTRAPVIQKRQGTALAYSSTQRLG